MVHISPKSSEFAGVNCRNSGECVVEGVLQKEKSEIEILWRWLREAPEMLPPVCADHHTMYSARTELIFFIVVCMVLCCVLERVLIIQRCFSYCWAILIQNQSLSCSSHSPASEYPGSGQEVRRGQSWDGWPHWPQAYPTPYEVVLSNKRWGKMRKRGKFSYGLPK